ncbi:GNAT family N-acetyltransferase [Flavobacterium sp. W1B]|uniref:GNAT family N-acetyltransferase n=1 Tax=Flavobacterium sp. W1B TaxID=3394146 RepID=UPI0039BC793A
MKFNNQKYFNQKTERLTFRKLSINDIESWKEFFEENNSLSFLGIDVTKTASELSEGWINKQLERYENEGLGHLAVIENVSGKFIGMGGILVRNIENNQEYEIAYSLKPKYWKKGFGTEIANQMRLFGLENSISKKFISIIDKRNLDSINVAKKNHMTILSETEYLGMNVYIYGIQIQ